MPSEATIPSPRGSAATTAPGGTTAPGTTAPGTAASAGTAARAVAAAAPAVILVCAALVVLGAASRPSFLTAPSHYGFFPHWMAGPLGGLWTGFTRSPKAIKTFFTASLLVTYVAYLLALRHVGALRARWAIAAVVGAHAILLLSPPLALTDVFNYINYGRMGVLHHLNPYTTIPMFEPHSDPSFFLSNWHKLLSPYGPLFTLLTYAVVPLGIAGSLWTLKVLLTAASLGTVLLVWKCARLLGRDPVRAIVFVGLNPIVLLWGLGGDHNDFLMVFLIVLAFWLLLRARAPGISPEVGADAEGAGRAGGRLVPLAAPEIGAGVAMAAAIGVKASAGIVVPMVLAGLVRTPRRLVQVVVGLTAGGIALVAASTAAFGPHLPDLGTQGRLTIPMSIPNVVGLALGQGGETDAMRTILLVALLAAVAGCVVFAWRRRDAITASGWTTAALLVTLSWVLPWYVLWLLPLAALSRSRALRRTALAIGAWLILTWMPSATAMDNALHIRPTRTPLGQLHQREVKRLLN